MADTIQISKNLLFQLVDDDAKSKKKPKKSKTKVPRESLQSQKKVPQKLLPDESTAQKDTPSGWPIQPPFFLPVPSTSNPELEAIRSVLKESETVLEKLRKHEENMLKEVTQRSKELHEKEFKLPQQKTIVCLSERDACTACYKEHTQDSLKCANFVQSYRDCVQRAKNLGNLLG